MQSESSLHTIKYAGQPVPKAPDWKGLVSLDLLLNNMAIGLFLAAGVSQLVAPEIFTPLAKVAYPIAFILLLADLLSLVLDLGESLRFHHMLRVFKPGSPMSVGTWSLSIFSGLLFLIAALNFLPAAMLPSWIFRLMLSLAILPALGSILYKGVLFSTTSQPGWQNARWLGGYLTNSALMLGCAQMLIISLVVNHGVGAAIFRSALIVLLLLNLIPKGLLAANLRPTLTRLYIPRGIWSVGALLLVLGVLLPLLLLIISSSPLFMVIAVSCMVIESLISRLLFVRLPHTPKEPR